MILLRLVLAVINTVLFGYAVQLGWNWFVFPFGLPNLDFWHALGLSTLLSLITGVVGGITTLYIQVQLEDKDKKERAELLAIGARTIMYSLSLLFMYFYHYMMMP